MSDDSPGTETTLPPAAPQPAGAGGPWIPIETGIGGAIASFGNELFIHPSKRFPDLDQGPVCAYAASNRPDFSQIGYFALVCEPGLTPRTRAAATFASAANSGLVKLVASGVVDWPSANAQRYVFIYDLPAGRPLCKEGHFTGAGLRADILLNAIVKTIVPVISDLHDVDLIHGNIRPSTIYGVGSGTLERAILGECLSTPYSFTQPCLFEPLERAMAQPLGRGPGRADADLYSLGATLAVLIRSHDPMQGMTDEQIIHHRVEVGSLAAMTGQDRIPGNMTELFRGLLNDDFTQRWGMPELLNWLDGQHVSPRQGFRKSKAARPIQFHGERYFRPVLLAMDMEKNPTEAGQMIETKALEQWISRSLEDQRILKRLESAIESAGEHGHGSGYWDRLLCRVSVALDPEAPIRYRGLSVFPEAIGTCLSQAILNKSDLQPYMDIITQQTPTFWVTSQQEDSVDIGTVVSRFDACRAFLRQNNIAYGIERCMYFLNPESPCLSEKLKKFYIRNAEDMMHAFEKLSTDPTRPELFFDRHSIAFLSVKDPGDIDAFLIELNSDDPYKKILGTIKTLATIQQRLRLEKFPGICRWIDAILDPVYKRFHDRDLREKLKKKISGFVESGDISKIAGTLTNPQTSSYDSSAYNQARQEYYRLTVEHNEIRKNLADPERLSSGIGREVAALTACILSGLAILFFAFMTFIRGGLF